MRLLILTKRSLITIGFCLVIALVATALVVSTTINSVQTASTEREIPIYCVDTDKKQVALSFDAAWGNEQTDTLLQILDKYNVKSTFFLVGQWVDNYPDSVKAIAEKGHDVGNHSNTHPYMTKLSTSDMTGQIQACNEKIKNITGNETTLFRAPYGDYNNDVVKSVNGCNMYCVQWDVDSLDWKDPTPQQITANVVKKVKNGSIILMHNGAKNTPEALPMVIEGLQEQGYEIVPISQILLQGEYYTDVQGKMCPKNVTTSPSD
ncbi:MAG: polysaccharide deacetylase family protein [Ruminococcus sp.]|nr:polysaccharide deacetylase family protein [Ruminococcus sp.]